MVLGAVCDAVVDDLVNHAIKSAKLSKKKIIKVEHLHEPGVEALSLYPLVCTLPNFTANANLFAQQRRDAELEAARKKARVDVWKEFRTRYNQTLARKKNCATLVLPMRTPELQEQAAPKVEDEADTEDVSVGKTNFVFYVMQDCKSIIDSNPEYAGVRFSTTMKRYLSDLIIEFIKRVAKQVGFNSGGTTSRKTINGDTILRTVEKMLVDGKQPVETITYEPA